MIGTKIKVNLGCGFDVKEGYLNVDAIKTTSRTVVQDLNEDWVLFKDNSIDEIYMKDVIEHLDNLQHLFGEVKRVLKVGGVFCFEFPHYKAPSAYKISHKNFFSWNTWNAFPEHYDINKQKKVFALKVTKNELVVEDRVFPFTLLNFVANLCPLIWEKFF